MIPVEAPKPAIEILLPTPGNKESDFMVLTRQGYMRRWRTDAAGYRWWLHGESYRPDSEIPLGEL